MAVTLMPVGPGIDPTLQALLQNFADAIGALQQPGAPMPIFVIDTLANLLSQAPADAYRGCFAQVTDKGCIAHSVNVSGTWTWLRADGSAF